MGLVRLLFSFNGRISRAEYLLGLAIVVGVSLLWWGVVCWIALRSFPFNTRSVAIDLISVVLGLWGGWVSLATAAKRLHDLNMSGFWCLAALIPLVGFVAPLLFLLIPGEEYANQYGPVSSERRAA
jgi:uncharacterized membrane protein YhaH (DUF805 family)